MTRPLTGEWTVEYSMASASGMFDIAHHCWHPDALRAAGIDASALSTPVSGTRAFRLMPDSPIAKLGLGDEVAVFLGGGDGPLANIGSGASRIGAINIDLGTSGAARCTAGAPTTDASASLWCFCLTEALWTYGGIVTNVGNSYQWLATTAVEAGGGDLDAAFNFLNRQAATVSAGSDGLLFMRISERRARHTGTTNCEARCTASLQTMDTATSRGLSSKRWRTISKRSSASWTSESPPRRKSC